jgi:hypothetical protein
MFMPHESVELPGQAGGVHWTMGIAGRLTYFTLRPAAMGI